MKFAELKSVDSLTESPTVEGVWFKRISFNELDEFQSILNRMSADDAERDSLNEIANATFWLFENVFCGEDGSKFEDILSADDVKSKVPVIIVRRLFDDAVELLLGGSQQGNDLETPTGDS